MKHNSIQTIAAAGVAALSLAAGAANVDFWQLFPGLPEAPRGNLVPRAMMPKGRALAQMADNEYESVVLNVDNQEGKILSYSVDASALERAVPGLKVEVRSSWSAPIASLPRGGKAQQFMGATSYGEPGKTGDPLFPCPANRVLSCPPWENRSVWLTLHTTGAKAGVYTAPVKFAFTDGVKEFPVTVEVWPFALADKLDILVYHWDYASSPETVKDEVEHGVNCFMMPFNMMGSLKLKDGQFTAKFALREVKAKLAAAPDAYFIGSYGFFGEFCDWAQKNKVEYMSDDFKAYFKQAIRALVRDLREIGLGYDRYWLQHWDEANGATAKKVLEMGPVAKEADPNVRWFFDHMSNWGEITGLAPYSQMMGPRGEGVWSKPQMDWYQNDYRKMHKDAKLLLFKQKGIYRGEGGVFSSNRARSWRVWTSHFDGCCTFAHAYCVYFWASSHPVPVRQWEVARDGYEDYKYFELYMKLAEKAGQRDEAYQTINRLVDNYVGPSGPMNDQVYMNDCAVPMTYVQNARQILAKKIAALKGVTMAEPLKFAPPIMNYTLPEGAREVALADRKAMFGETKFPIKVRTVEFRLADNSHVVYPLQFAVDDYTLSVPGALTEGEEYRLEGAYSCPATKSPEPKLQIAGIASNVMYCRERDGKPHGFSHTFRVPAGVKDLDLWFKEIRNMSGDTVLDRCELTDLRLTRLTAGGKKLPKALPAPKIPAAKPWKGSFAGNQLAFRGATLQPGRYAFKVDYVCDRMPAQSVRIIDAQDNARWPAALGANVLQDTKGRVATSWTVFDINKKETEILASVGVKGGNQAIMFDDWKGGRVAPNLTVKDIRLYAVPGDPRSAAALKANALNRRAFLDAEIKRLGAEPKVAFAFEPTVGADGKKTVRVSNYRDDHEMVFLLKDPSANEFGIREIVVPRCGFTTVEIPAQAKKSEFMALVNTAKDHTIDW